MEIKEALLERHSKSQTMKLVAYIGRNEDRFGQLMELFFAGDKMLQQRSGWVMSYCAEAHPELMDGYLKRMLDNLERKDLHDAVKRNSLKVLSALSLDESLQGQAATLAFDFLADPKEKVATKVFAMELLFQICKSEPDLAGELRLLIEDQMPLASPGFRARGKRILNSLPAADIDF